MGYSRMEIIKEYCNYCKDRKIDYKKIKNKNQFCTDYILQDIKMNGIKNLKEKQKAIEMALKYNNLTIKYFMENLTMKTI